MLFIEARNLLHIIKFGIFKNKIEVFEENKLKNIDNTKQESQLISQKQMWTTFERFNYDSLILLADNIILNKKDSEEWQIEKLNHINSLSNQDNFQSQVNSIDSTSFMMRKVTLKIKNSIKCQIYQHKRL